MQRKIRLFLSLILTLLLTIGTVLAAPYSQVNLIEDPSFESGTLDYYTSDASGISSITVQSSVKQSGSYAASFYKSSGSSGVHYGYLEQDVETTSAGSTLTIYTYDHASGGTGYTYYDVYLDSYSTSFPSTTTSDGTWGTWVKHDIDLTTFCGGSQCNGWKTLKIAIGFGSNHYGNVYVDNMKMYSTAPVPSFTGSPVIGKAPLTVNFAQTDTHTTSYEWFYGDGASEGSNPAPSHSYTTAGSTYTVTHWAKNEGGYVAQTRTNYITTNATLVAGFSGTPTSGTAPLSVQFTDSSTGTPTAWNWDFGDGNTTSHTLQNPAHLYTAAGSYSVNLTVTNADGSTHELKSNYVTVSGVAAHEGMAIGGKIYDTLSFVGLSGVQMTLVNATTPTWSSITYTNASGYYAFNNLSTSTSINYVVSATKTGYLDTATTTFSLTAQEVANSYSDKSFGMEVIGSSSAANQGVGGKYAPNIVRFTIKYWNGQPIKGVNVTAQGFQSTAGNGTFADAATILGTLFGFDFVTTPIQSQSMTGTTGTDGAIAFWMVENVNYHVTFTLNGQELVTPIDVYPKEYEYPITVPAAAVPSSSIDTNYTLTTGALNNSHSYITVNYTDWNYNTDTATVTFARVVNDTYSVTNYSRSFSGAGAANFSVTYNPITHAGDQYRVTLYTVNTVFGTRNVSKLVTIPGRTLDLKLQNNDYYAWIALIVLYLIAQMGGSRRTRDVSVILTFFAGFLAVVGWLSITTLLLQAAMMFGVLYYVRTGEEQ